jgi:hypothetical protein
MATRYSLAFGTHTSLCATGRRAETFRTHLLLASNPELILTKTPGLIAWLKANPRKASAGIAGVGSLANLATVTRDVMAMDGAPEASFVFCPQLPPVHDRAFQLLDLDVKVKPVRPPANLKFVRPINGSRFRREQLRPKPNFLPKEEARAAASTGSQEARL